MSEANTPRLMAAAKEFNIGSQTLIDFLVSRNFSADDLKPTAKLTEDMYRVLQGEFQSDKAAKQKAEAIDLPKGAAEAKKKKDEEDLSIKKKEEKVKAEKAAQEEEDKQAAEAAAKAAAEKAAEEANIVKIEAPEVTAPKVLDKIDL